MFIETPGKLQWDQRTRRAFIASKDLDLIGAKAVVAAAMKRAERYAAEQILSRIAKPQSVSGKALQTALIKPIGDSCNIACSYCYETGLRPAKTRVMSLPDLRAVMVRLLARSEGPLLIYVHGGEPLLAGREWFRALADIVSQYGRTDSVEFGVQTNGILLDTKWVEFLVEHNFNIGLSLDGPPDQHDSSRLDHSERGTHRRVMAALRLLQSHKARHGITAVLTQQLALMPGSIEALFRFFMDEGVAQFDVHPAWSPNAGLRRYNLMPAEYARAMALLFEEWIASGRTDVLIRSFEFFFQAMAKARPAACHRAGACMSILGVEPDGRVVPCVRPFPSEYTFGNLITSPLEAIVESEAYDRFKKEEERGRRQNHQCRWHHLCGGGCPHERYTGERPAVAGVHAYCTCDTDPEQGYPGLFEYMARRSSQILVG